MRKHRKDHDPEQQKVRSADPSPAHDSRAESILHLQRAAGNASVSALVGEQEDSPVTSLAGSAGRPLDGGVRSAMESRLGGDFSDVRIHEGPDASASSRSIQAKAYTTGTDIVLGDDVGRPGSVDGDRTLAHELTHVMQQKAGPVDGNPGPGGVQISDPSDRFEQAAEHNAEAATGGPSTAAAHAMSPSAQREVEDELAGPRFQREKGDNLEDEEMQE